MRERLLQAERQKVEAIAGAQAKLMAAEEAKLAAEQRVQVLAEAQEAMINERVQEREALKKDKTTAVLAEQAKSFEVRQKLEAKVDELQRQIRQERAHELGEGAEIDLFEELKRAFEDDRITRVKKGTPGADIIHEVVHNGKVCGRIVYDSKNRNRWATEYVTKLREDQLAASAQHAILSSLKFPKDMNSALLPRRRGRCLPCPCAGRRGASPPGGRTNAHAAGQQRGTRE